MCLKLVCDHSVTETVWHGWPCYRELSL